MSIDCDVCISGYDRELADEYYITEFRSARQPVKCCECERVIAKGEPYRKDVGVWNGEPSTWRTCTECSEVREAFSCGGGWVFGALWESLYDLLDDITPGCFNRLTTAKAKSKLRDFWVKSRLENR